MTRYAPDVKLPQHHSSHRDLLPYANLMLWLKDSDDESFQKLVKVGTPNFTQGTHYTGKTGKMVKKNPCQGKHREIGNSAKTQGIWFAEVDSKGKRYFYICRENSQIYFEAGYVYQFSLVYVIVTNHVNWHRENLQSDRENTGNLKMKFELGPCLLLFKTEVLHDYTKPTSRTRM